MRRNCMHPNIHVVNGDLSTCNTVIEWCISICRLLTYLAFLFNLCRATSCQTALVAEAKATSSSMMFLPASMVSAC
jgi:hypothetical protein